MQKTKVTSEILRELGFVEEYNCWKLFEKGNLVNLIYKNQLRNKTLNDLVKILTGTAHNIGFKKGMEHHALPVVPVAPVSDHFALSYSFKPTSTTCTTE